MSEGSRILITGVAGLLGSHLAEHLLSKGYEVYGIDNLSGGYAENVPDNVVLFVVDLVYSSAIDKIFDEVRPAYVYHFAGLSDLNEAVKEPLKSVKFNILATVKLLDLCLKYKINRFIN